MCATVQSQSERPRKVEALMRNINVPYSKQDYYANFSRPVASNFLNRNSALQLLRLMVASPTLESVMNWDVIEGNWAQYKGQVKAQWGKLTNDHIEVIAGKRDQLVGTIQEAYGVERGEADKQIKAFEKYLTESRPS